MSDAPAARPAPPLTTAPARLRRAAIVLIAVATATGLLGAALSPYLLVEHPLLLLALSPGPAHLVLAAGSLPPVPYLAVAIPRRIIGFVATYAFGALYGYRGARWLVKKSGWLGRLIEGAERLLIKSRAWMLLLFPSQGLALVAGAAGMRFRSFMLAISVSLSVMVSATYIFGDAVSKWTDYVLAFLQEHVIASTMVATSLVLFFQWRSRRKKKAEPPAPA